MNKIQLETLEQINMEIPSGCPKLTERDVRGWGITGDETKDEIEQMARDHTDRLHTEMNEAVNEWRYEV